MTNQRRTIFTPETADAIDDARNEIERRAWEGLPLATNLPPRRRGAAPFNIRLAKVEESGGIAPGDSGAVRLYLARSPINTPAGVIQAEWTWMEDEITLMEGDEVLVAFFADLTDATHSGWLIIAPSIPPTTFGGCKRDPIWYSQHQEQPFPTVSQADATPGPFRISIGTNLFTNRLAASAPNQGLIGNYLTQNSGIGSYNVTTGIWTFSLGGYYDLESVVNILVVGTAACVNTIRVQITWEVLVGQAWQPIGFVQPETFIYTNPTLTQPSTTLTNQHLLFFARPGDQIRIAGTVWQSDACSAGGAIFRIVTLQIKRLVDCAEFLAPLPPTGPGDLCTFTTLAYFWQSDANYTLGATRIWSVADAECSTGLTFEKVSATAPTTFDTINGISVLTFDGTQTLVGQPSAGAPFPLRIGLDESLQEFWISFKYDSVESESMFVDGGVGASNNGIGRWWSSFSVVDSVSVGCLNMEMGSEFNKAGECGAISLNDTNPHVMRIRAAPLDDLDRADFMSSIAFLWNSTRNYDTVSGDVLWTDVFDGTARFEEATATAPATATVNGLTALDFNGSTHVLDGWTGGMPVFPVAITDASTYREFWISLKFDTATGHEYFVAGNDGGTVDGIGRNASDQLVIVMNDAVTTFTTIDLSDTDPHWIRIFNTGTVNEYTVTLDRTTSETQTLTGANDLAISGLGRRQDESLYFNGKIMDVAITKPLSTYRVQQMHYYFGTRIGTLLMPYEVTIDNSRRQEKQFLSFASTRVTIAGLGAREGDTEYFIGKMMDVYACEAISDPFDVDTVWDYLMDRIGATTTSPDFVRNLNAVSWALLDQWLVDEDPALTTPRTCIPGPGTLTFAGASAGTDFAIIGGKLQLKSTNSITEDKYFYTAGQTRQAGLRLETQVNWTNPSTFLGEVGQHPFSFGWSNSADGTSTDLEAGMEYSIDIPPQPTGTCYDVFATGIRIEFPTYGVGFGESNFMSVVLRSTGHHSFVTHKGVLKHLTVISGGTTATLYGQFSNYDADGSYDRAGITLEYFGIPSTLWTPTPIASDSFNRADNTDIGSTDDAGVEETGGATLAWTQASAASGVAEIVSNNLECTSITPGDDVVCWIECSESDVIIEGVFGPGPVGRGAGVVLRYLDINNYWLVLLDDGLNTITLRKIVAGTPTTIDSAALNGTAPFNLHVAADYSTIRADVWSTSIRTHVEVQETDTFNRSETKHGVYLGDASGTPNPTCERISFWKKNVTDYL